MIWAAMMLLALGIDAAIGWPDALYRRAGHPVVWIGTLISFCERRWNRGGRRRRIALGALTVAVVTATSAGVAAMVAFVLPDGWAGVLIGGVLAWPFVAVRSLHDHVAAVAKPLGNDDLGAARHAVSMIVGRDVTRLDKAGVARAGIESLAENASDGVIAPLFWGVLLGLPGIVGYKAINTLDSMIGHRSDRYEAFGKLAARLDDAVNLIPARLTGGLFALIGGAQALRAMTRDAGAHRSPNAGWPEGAMAGALGVRLSGPRVYETHVAEEPWLNADAADPDGAAMSRALTVYRRGMMLAAAVLALLALV
ncbi:adenosylcobinamide-phosphate synthase CbiB [Sagittula salina]|uniref:Cobalamin biosynthesis protein CobD n=1 Tax=Sagittula salina TaxID=2820268 RepID=A0A940S396_9RHOB|nr:adenosylcobinamide-phosphate synthase CbiB [Sagittula salina]MBP0484877.1 cobalamin biosynthesis protein CobD [Sagittula salina]